MVSGNGWMVLKLIHQYLKEFNWIEILRIVEYFEVNIKQAKSVTEIVKDFLLLCVKKITHNFVDK